MLDQRQQEQVLALVKSTKKLIFRELESARVSVKGRADYVTNVDFAVQDYLQTELGKLFPEVAMIAEEKENKDLREDGTYWILDPIDGTTNLIHHYGISSVSLAYYEQGSITFGIVYNPFHEELFYAAKGHGAYLNGKSIHTTEDIEMKDAVISYGSSPYEKERAEENFKIYKRIFLECSDFRRIGSAALDLCYIACGRHHGFMELSLKPWDYAAGSLIVQEAGGVARRRDGSQLRYLEKSSVMACSASLEKEYLRLLNEE